MTKTGTYLVSSDDVILATLPTQRAVAAWVREHLQDGMVDVEWLDETGQHLIYTLEFIGAQWRRSNV